MRNRSLLVVAALAAIGSLWGTPKYASADATCYLDGVGIPTPIPAGRSRVTLPKCLNNILLTAPSDLNGSPLPVAPTPPFAVTLPVTFQTAFPTPIPFPATQSVTQGTSPWIVNTPAPFSGVVTQGTSPWIVNTPPPFNGAVTGTFFQAVQPVSLPVTFQTSFPTPPATQAVTGTFFQATQPVSGTLTVNTPPPFSGIVTQATAANLNATVTGTVTANAGTGTMTVGQATGTNLHAVLDAAANVIGKVSIDQTTGGTTNLVQAKVCDSSNAALCAKVSGSAGFLSVGGYVDGGGLTVQPKACGSSVAVNISTATTTSLVAVSGSTSIYVCSYSLYVVSGTLPSFKFEYGTGAACVTTQTVLTGTYGGIAGTVGELFTSGMGIGTIFTTPASQALCLVSAGTTPNIQGVVTYSQF